MATGTVTRVTIYDTMVDSLFLPGGDAWDWMERVGRQHLQMSLVEVPRRTGFLASQHNLALTPVGRRNVRYTVGNYAEHSQWVHQGTTGPIMSPNGKLHIRAMPHSWFPTGAYLNAVRGQTANPWIERAGGIVLARYGVRP